MQVIDAVAKRELGSRDRVNQALADDVAALSQLYTRARDQLHEQAHPLAARLRFFLPRDMPKVQGALRELDHAGCLPQSSTWKVLDLGAGLGTTTLGIADFAHGRGIDTLEVTAVERDAASLRLFRALAEECRHNPNRPDVPSIELDARTGDLRDLPNRSVSGPWDLIVVGLALNELWRDASDCIARRAAWLKRLRSTLTDNGSLIVIEPALRDVSRNLHRVCAHLESHNIPAFSPSTHTLPCPLLRRERDWCHEQDSSSLPDELIPVAKAAGLRFERLTWSALVLRRDGRRLSDGGWRVVGGPLKSKGRCEWHACGVAGHVRVARLDRHKSKPDAFDDVGRGSVLGLPNDVKDGSTNRTDKVPVDVLWR